MAILARNDSYGTGLAGTAQAALEEAGVEVVYNKVYDEKAQTFDAEVDEMVAADADAILLIAFDEASRILTTMVEKGTGRADQSWYACWVDDPTRPIVVVVTVEEGGFGAEAAAPAARLILSKWFGVKEDEFRVGSSHSR